MACPDYAEFVCLPCKQRKKTCDKKLPRCSYCQRRSIACAYVAPASVERKRRKVSTTPTSAASVGSTPAATTSGQWAGPTSTELLSPKNSKETVLERLTYLLQNVGQYADELSHRYFQGAHRWLPFMSRDIFNASLVRFPASRNADFGFLLLCVCLTARQDSASSQQDLYLAAKQLLAQLQICTPVSRDLIKGVIVLAVYEYTIQNVEVALCTLSMAIRLAYSIDLERQDQDGTSEQRERNDVWWMLVMCERLFVLEARNTNQPLLTPFPSSERPLPGTLGGQDSLPAIMSFSNVNEFGRAAQASRFLDQILRTLHNSQASVESEATRIDADLQSFLSLLLEQSRSGKAEFCGAIAISLKAMITLQQQILSRSPENGTAQAAMRTAANIIKDIAVAHRLDPHPEDVDAYPPTYVYNLQAVMRHFGGEGDDEDLVEFLQAFRARWDAEE